MESKINISIDVNKGGDYDSDFQKQLYGIFEEQTKTKAISLCYVSPANEPIPRGVNYYYERDISFGHIVFDHKDLFMEIIGLIENKSIKNGLFHIKAQKIGARKIESISIFCKDGKIKVYNYEIEITGIVNNLKW